MLLNRWRMKRQTKGNAITIGNEKPMLDNNINRDRIAVHQMLTIPATINPEKSNLVPIDTVVQHWLLAIDRDCTAVGLLRF